MVSAATVTTARVLFCAVLRPVPSQSSQPRAFKETAYAPWSGDTGARACGRFHVVTVCEVIARFPATDMRG